MRRPGFDGRSSARQSQAVRTIGIDVQFKRNRGMRQGGSERQRIFNRNGGIVGGVPNKGWRRLLVDMQLG